MCLCVPVCGCVCLCVWGREQLFLHSYFSRLRFLFVFPQRTNLKFVASFVHNFVAYFFGRFTVTVSDSHIMPELYSTFSRQPVCPYVGPSVCLPVCQSVGCPPAPTCVWYASGARFAHFTWYGLPSDIMPNNFHLLSIAGKQGNTLQPQAVAAAAPAGLWRPHSLSTFSGAA